MTLHPYKEPQTKTQNTHTHTLTRIDNAFDNHLKHRPNVCVCVYLCAVEGRQNK